MQTQSVDPVPPPPPFNRLVETRHGRMLINVNDIYVGRSLEVYGEFSELELAAFAQIVKAGDLVVDAGANIGAFTVPLAKMVGTKGFVLAFEPQRIAFQTLCANVALNDLANVWTFNSALGDRDGDITVPEADPRQPGNFGGIEVGKTQGGSRVQLSRLDSMTLPRCALIKIDVEGMESAVLRGAEQTIAKHRPTLFVENDRAELSDNLIRQLRAMDYQLFWHKTPLFNPDNFRGNKENVFGGTLSLNMACVPNEQAWDVRDMEPVHV